MKKRFIIAKEIFKEFRVPVQLVLLLFADIFPRVYISRLIEMFEINTKEIPYYEFVRQKDMGVFEYQYKSTPMPINNPYISLTGQDSGIFK